MKRKEITILLNKIKWFGKVSKLPHLNKLLKNLLVSPKVDSSVVMDYLLTENATFKYIYMYQDTNDDFILEYCEIEVVKKLFESFESIYPHLHHPLINEILGIDIQCLYIILNYMSKNYQQVILLYEQLNKEYNVIQMTFDKTSTHTMKLLAESTMYYIITCLKHKNNIPDGLTSFCLKTFQELCYKYELTSNNTKKKVTIPTIPRMHIYIIIALRLHVALLASKNNYTLNMTWCFEIYKLMTNISQSADNKITNPYNDRYVYVPLSILIIHIMICFWSTVSVIQLIDDVTQCGTIQHTTTTGERYRSKSINSTTNEKYDIHSNRDNNIIFIASCSRYVLNYLGKIYLSCSEFRLRNIETCVNTFIAIPMVIYSAHCSAVFVSNICFDAMKCAYKNSFIHYCFGASSLANKRYIVSRNTFEALLEFSDIETQHDNLTISSLLLLLYNYINHTTQIDSAIALIETKILPNQQQLTSSILAIIYLAYAICFIYKSKYVLPCENNRMILLEQALIHINNAYNIDCNHGEIVFYRSYINAKLGNIDESINDVHVATKLLPYDPRPYHLHAILLTCKKQYDEAYSIVTNALATFDSNINLLYLKIKLIKYIPIDNLLKDTFLEFNELNRLINRFVSFGKKIKMSTSSSCYVPNIMTFQSCDIGDDSTLNHMCSTLTTASNTSPDSVYHTQNTFSFNNTVFNPNNKNVYNNPYFIDPKSIDCTNDAIFNLYFALWEVADDLHDQCSKDLFDQLVSLYPLTPECIYIQEYYLMKKDTNRILSSETFLQCLSLHPRHPRLLDFHLHMLKKQLTNLNNDNLSNNIKDIQSNKSIQLLNSMEYYAKLFVEVEYWNYKPYQILGEILLQLGKLDQASKTLRTALDIENSQPIVSLDTVPLVFCPSDY